MKNHITFFLVSIMLATATLLTCSCVDTAPVNASIVRSDKTETTTFPLTLKRIALELSKVNEKETKIRCEYQDQAGQNHVVDITKDVYITDISNGIKVVRYKTNEDNYIIQTIIEGGPGIYSFNVSYLSQVLTIRVQKKGATFKILYPATDPKNQNM